MQLSFNILKFNGWRYFFLLIGLTFLPILAINYLFLTADLYYQSYGDQLNNFRISKLIEISQKWQWIGYLFIPIAILLRVCFTAICLYTGSFLANIKIGFNQTFRIALISDFVFVSGDLVKLVILIFFKNINTIADLQIQPLSLLQLFEQSSVDPIFIYPLSLINFFELIYWLVLAKVLSVEIGQSFDQSIKEVASSYGVGLLLWVLFIMFLNVNLT